MAAESLSRYLAWWDMLTTNGKPRLSDLPHLEPIVRELDASIAEARELQGLIQGNAEEGLMVPAPDRPPGRDATAEDAGRRIHHQRRSQRGDITVGARKSINRRTTGKSEGSGLKIMVSVGQFRPFSKET